MNIVRNTRSSASRRSLRGETVVSFTLPHLAEARAILTGRIVLLNIWRGTPMSKVRSGYSRLLTPKDPDVLNRDEVDGNCEVL